ncbi:MAG: phage holin family protein [Acidimicrobiales bacterium]
MSDGQDQLATRDTADDWPAQATAQIVKVVDLVRGKTTEPATTAARAIVFGLLAALLGTTALVLFAVAFVRVIDVYVPGEVWSAHLIVGGVFFLAGVFIFRKRHPKRRSEAR